nr:FtsQ-type POTRA domain-containing protein [Clostridia bacterium]
MDGRGWNTGSQPPAGQQYPAGSQPPTSETWQSESPFEEPEQAPELRDSRSDNLYSRDEPFWNRVVDANEPVSRQARDANYWNHPDVMKEDKLLRFDNERPREKVRRWLGSDTLKWFLAGAAVLALILALVYWSGQVRVINVVGNVQVPEQEVISRSGIRIGQNGWSIDEEAVMRRVESHRYLRCTLVDVQLDTVTIHVREREPKAYLNHNGMLITLDNRGFVLEETLDTDAADASLVKVSGLSIRRCALGQKINLTMAEQLETYTKILVELEAMQGLSMIRELDMASMDSIYLVTKDDFQVRLGDEDKIHEKLRAFMITKKALEEMSDTRGKKGTIDVADPAEPTFMSEEAARLLEEAAQRSQ